MLFKTLILMFLVSFLTSCRSPTFRDQPNLARDSNSNNPNLPNSNSGVPNYNPSSNNTINSDSSTTQNGTNPTNNNTIHSVIIPNSSGSNNSTPNSNTTNPSSNTSSPSTNTSNPTGTTSSNPNANVGNPTSTNPANVNTNPINNNQTGNITDSPLCSLKESDFFKFSFNQSIENCLARNKIWNFLDNTCSTINSFVSNCNWNEAMRIANSTPYINSSSSFYINQFKTFQQQGAKLISCAKSDSKGVAIFQLFQPPKLDRIKCAYDGQSISTLCIVQNFNSVPASIRNLMNTNTDEFNKRFMSWCMNQS